MQENLDRRSTEDRRSTPSSSEDERWIAATLAGDRESYGQLIRKYQGKLYDLALRVLRSAPEAEDILQEAFLEAFRHLADFNRQSKFSTWIYSIALNRCRNRLRHHRVLRWLSLDKAPDDRDGARPFELPDHEPSPEIQTDNKIQLEAIEKAVRDFPLHYQSIFILYYFHGLSVEEAAERLGRPASTVKVYLHRARKLLYQRLKPKRDAVTAQAAEVSN